MIIEDRGIFLSCRKFHESGYIIECLLENHGLLRGYARLNCKYGSLIPGCIVKIVWKARLESHLGYITLENEKCVSPLVMFDSLRNLALDSGLSLVATVLHEREAHTQIYTRLETFLETLGCKSDSYLKHYAFLEVELLGKSGFGLDLSMCAVTNSTENLVYVSPKTGRAVSADTGLPYHDKLFPLPQFLRYQDSESKFDDVYNTLIITGHFFGKHIWSNCQTLEPPNRARLKTALLSKLCRN